MALMFPKTCCMIRKKKAPILKNGIKIVKKKQNPLLVISWLLAWKVKTSPVNYYGLKIQREKAKDNKTF